ncbi:spermidine/putrescine ABC transporter permease [Frondihabitans sucicola]|uniref:Spermidine/putrescine ABC transporter permease n=1 Tax=Frondihabitans sucicola TaxID=1268041 RepID=A0ABN6XU23_9MICO|nr:ABC transporter permease [Frondihabitans sucicola]BDZ48469.1 spermidine/putrescine ABC transporter permease [Frondihabitans sucicola]
MTTTVERPRETRSQDPEMVEPRRRRRPILPLVYWIVTGITLVPIAFMVVYSFNDVPTGRISFHWSGFTPYWYINLGQVSGLTQAFVTSVEIALLSAVISIVLGVPLALALERYRFLLRGPLNATVYADIAAPSIVVGAASLSFFLSASVSTGFLTILLVHVAFNLAYVVVVLRARLSGVGTALEEAAGDLGAPPFVAFRTITLPLLLPGIIAGGMLSLAMSIDDYVITSFVAGPSVTFPLFVYGAAKVGLPPQVLCFGTIIFAVGLLAALVNGFITRRAPRAAVDDG